MLLSLIKIFKIEIIKLLKKLMEGNMKRTLKKHISTNVMV